MLRGLFKVAAILAVVVAVTGLLGLFVVSSLARIHGVETVDIPVHGALSAPAREADYADAYRIEMEFNPFRTIDDVADNAFEKGRGETHRDDNEVAYEGVAPGLRYQVSYILDRQASPATLTVCTTVTYVERSGRVYFAFVKPIHRLLMPFMVDRMSRAVVD